MGKSELLLVSFVLICVFIICESLFCYMMKKFRQKDPASNILHNEPTKQKGDVAKIHKRIPSLICLYFFKFANDLTFLFFKIIGYIPIHFIRYLFYKYVFHVSISKNVVIYYGLEARNPWNITICENSIIGDHCILDARYGIRIGTNVNLSTGVWIWTLQHNVNSSSFGTEGQAKGVIVEDRVWISGRTTILPGCILGEGCVIATGAVLTNSTEPFGIYGGIPAKLLKFRNKQLFYEFSGEHRMFL